MTPATDASFLNELYQKLVLQASPIKWLGVENPDNSCAKWALLIAISDGQTAAKTVSVSDETLAGVWTKAKEWLSAHQPFLLKKIRLDWVTKAQQISLLELRSLLAKTKRNYARIGLAIDPSMRCALHEQELNAHGVFCADSSAPNATSFSFERFSKLVNKKFNPSNDSKGSNKDKRLVIFRTSGIYAAQNDPITRQPTVECLTENGVGLGRRIFHYKDLQNLEQVLRAISLFLLNQSQKDGKFRYGVFPRFSKEIAGYNTIRHSLAAVALFRLYEVFNEKNLLEGARNAWTYLQETHIKALRLDRPDELFVIEESQEIKLGASGLALYLACLIHKDSPSALTHQVIDGLVSGVERFCDFPHRRINHVLKAPGPHVHEEFRIIYYEGEVLLGLLKAYEATKSAQALNLAKKIFLILHEKKAWRFHDHWLAEAAFELSLLCPELASMAFRFAIENTHTQLGFIASRKTAFPTLLEQALAYRSHLHHEANKAHKSQRQNTELAGLNLAEIDLAIERRVDLVLNGFFWPEFAMYFPKPNALEGGFFIRHHDFRVRIDDVAHAALGLIGYRAMRHAIPPPAMS